MPYIQRDNFHLSLISLLLLCDNKKNAFCFRYLFPLYINKVSELTAIKNYRRLLQERKEKNETGQVKFSN